MVLASCPLLLDVTASSVRLVCTGGVVMHSLLAPSPCASCWQEPKTRGAACRPAAAASPLL